MANRCTLHLSHMEAFKQWLAENSYAFRDGKGDFQVLQVMTDNDGWQSIYSRLDMPEHYTVQDKLMYLVKRFFLANRKSADEITRLRQQVAKLTEQRDIAVEFVEEVRRSGDTRLSSMAIATLSKLEVRK